MATLPQNNAVAPPSVTPTTGLSSNNQFETAPSRAIPAGLFLPTPQNPNNAPAPQPTATPVAPQVAQVATPQPQPTPQPIAQATQPSQPTVSSPSGASLTDSNGQPLDPGVLSVMRTIRQVESQGNYNAIGDNGASAGAFQWNNAGQPLATGQIPVNFQNAAKQFNLDPTDFSQGNQNHVAYDQIAAYKAKGLSPIQVDALWNGAHYDQATQTYIHNNPQRAQQFTQTLASMQSGTQAPQADTTAPPPTPAPSVGGFLGNVVSSGANLVGNIGNAVLHPIQTIQNLGSIPVGGLQELGGQTTPNTQNFDNVVNYFKQRYGGVSNLEKTVYSDPVGFLADLSTVLTGGAGAVGLASKGAELAGLGETVATAAKAAEVANVAGEAGTAADLGGVANAGKAGFVSDINAPTATAAQTGAVAQGSGLADALMQTSNGLNRAATLTNPLTPVVSGIGSLLSGGKLPIELTAQILGKEPETVSDMIRNPQDYTPESMANNSRQVITSEVQDAFKARTDALRNDSQFYGTISKMDTPVSVAKNWLEDTFRKTMGVNVEDGELTPSTASRLTSSDLSRFQEVLDTYKPSFQTGAITPSEFWNLRGRLQDLSYTEAGLKNTKMASYADDIRSALNTDYRDQIPNLAEHDANVSSEIKSVQILRKGFFDKEGNLTQGGVTRIANALNKGKITSLENSDISRLEQIVPGITRRIQAMKFLEDWNASGTKVGSYTRSLSQAARIGSIIYGGLSGDIRYLAGGMFMDYVSNPDRAMKIMQTVAKIHPEAVKATLGMIGRYALVGGVSSNAAQNGTQSDFSSNATGDQSALQSVETPTGSPQSAPLPTNVPQPSLSVPNTANTQLTMPTQGSNSLPDNNTAALISSSGYTPASIQAAIAAGHTPAQIQSFMNAQTGQ